MIEYIQKSFEQAEMPISGEQAEKLSSYMAGILEKNRFINLTSITEEKEFVKKHYLDSASAGRLPSYQQALRIIDLGTGGGFPGIPLAILSPDKEFVLADSLAKRLDVIRELMEKTGIKNVELVHGRAEDLGKDPSYRECFDICVSRAVADLAVLAEYCLPLVRIGGSFIAYKGPGWEEEVKRAEKAVAILGGSFFHCHDAGSTENGHVLLEFKKVSETPYRYPRKAGIPTKKPIL